MIFPTLADCVRAVRLAGLKTAYAVTDGADFRVVKDEPTRAPFTRIEILGPGVQRLTWHDPARN